MKKLSKESMQQFMLLHAEKLILSVCLVLTGAVVWMSMGAKSELDQTPEQLLAAANTAQATINSGDAWDKLAPFRKGNDTVKEQIVSSPIVDAKKFNLSDFQGRPAAALASRQDPRIFAPQQLQATRLIAGLMMEVNRESVIDRFIAAPIKVEEEEDDRSRRSREELDEYDEFESENLGDGSDARGSDSRRSGIGEVPLPELDHNGQQFQVNEVMANTFRPTTFGFTPASIKSAVFDVVCVTAVVDYQKQIEEFEQVLADSVAYFPERDRPVYQFLQVQRRVAGDDQWTDISELVSYSYPSRFPRSMHKMPFKLYSTAPEVAAAENWDPLITKEIPAFASTDYSQFCLHPALGKARQFPARQKAEERGKMQGSGDKGDAVVDIFDPTPEEEAAGSDLRFGGQFDLDDPNIRRNGSVFIDYEESLFERKAKDQYKLVRFFDLQPPRNKTCEYRVRVWLGDPNHEDPENGFMTNRGSRFDEDGRTVSGLEGDIGRGGDLGLSGGSSRRNQEKEEEEEEEVYDYRMVVKSMLHPDARKRLASATQDEEVLDDPIGQFFVSEYFDGDSKELTKVMLPPSKRKFAYIRYLRYARPSQWSDTVQVAPNRVSSRVVAGKAKSGRTVSVTRGEQAVEFETEEGPIGMVVASWFASIGAEVPSQRQVYRGETLNFDANAYVLHPVNQRWVVAENPRARSEESKYVIPFRTGQTVVDAIAGKTLDLPGANKKVYDTPAEVLIMDPLGNMTVANEFEQETEFRNLTAMSDESREVGRRKRRRPKPDDEDFENFGF